MANKSTDSNNCLLCTKCFNPLITYQLNLNEAMKICLNQNCASQSFETFQRSFQNTQPVLEKFNSFYTEEKYISSNQLILSLSNQIESEISKLNSSIEKFDQPTFECLEESDLDLLSHPLVNEPTSCPTLELSNDQYGSDLLLSDLNFSDFSNLLDLDEDPTLDQSLLDAPSSTQKSVLAELQPVKDELIFETRPSEFYHDVELVGSYSKNETNSSIRIEKIQSKSNKDSPKTSQEIKLSNLKLIDDKEDLMELIKTKESKTDLKNGVSQGKQALLPWEMKNKYKPKKKIEINPMQKLNKSENIPRIESKSVLNTNIKQLGSTLKKNMLNNSTLLSNLKTSSTSSGGYKDLVLSVLKKKT